MASQRRRWGRRPGWLACGLTAVALSLTGCVNMPDSGPPSSALVNQNDVGQNQAYDGPVPSPPKPGWSPEDIVQGFVFASASYYTARATVLAYLTPQASRTWQPGGAVRVFQTWEVTPPAPSSGRDAQRATVSVLGQVQAALNGNGQQLTSAAQGDAAAPRTTTAQGSCAQPDGSYAFTLAKQGGEWRISHAPSCLLLDESAFERFWKSQDLYFLDPTQRVLVPDSVFVPIGTSETDLLNRLTDALQAGPAAAWLSHGVSGNVFPPAKITVTADGPTAIVNLQGHVAASDSALPEMSAELVWTLTSASVGQPAIQSVDLEINGSQVFPLGPQQQLDQPAFASYNPYPSVHASFAYVDDNGVAQSACGSVQNALIARAVPMFAHGAAISLASCGSAAPATSPSPAPSATHTGKPDHGGKTAGTTTAATYAMAAVSPDGKEVALVSSDRDELSIGTVGGTAAPESVPVQKGAITSISWDRQHDLWFTQGGDISMVAPNRKLETVPFTGNATTLTVAPDGVRAALLVQQGGQVALELAAVNPNGNAQPHGSRVGGPTIGQLVPLGPGVTDAKAVTWYDADDLIVLDPQVGATSQMEEVPVNGRASTQSLAPLLTAAGVTVESIAAGNAGSVVVAGLSSRRLEVSAGFEGPWQDVGPGSDPSYWIPAP